MELQEIMDHTGLSEWILLGLFAVALVLQAGYYLLVYLKLHLYRPEKIKKSERSISVIICARNEEENLERFLPRVLEQEYPSFEVVVVNDSSTDGTENLLSELSVRYGHLRYTSIPRNEKFLHGKKLAVTIGMKSARYDHVVLTDADCYPVSPFWLQHMASRFTEKKQIVLGYGGYERRRGLLNILIRYETVFTAIQYLSFAIKGRPYMGVGRNLAYEKGLFFSNKGFASHYHLASGDDDLFINETARRGNTVVEFTPESHTRSVPEMTLRSWIKQKKRHLTAGSHYRRGSRIRLGTEWCSRIALYSTLITLCIISSWIWVVLTLFGIFLGIRMTIFKLGMRRLDERYLLLPSLLLDPVMPLVLGLIWLSNIFEKKRQPWS